MSLGAIIAAPLLRGLGWFLLALAAFILMVIAMRAAGWLDGATARYDWWGVGLCATLGAASLMLAAQFRRLR